MDMTNPLDNTLQTRFSLEQAKVGDLNRGLRSLETREQLKKTARQFEGLFLKQMMDAMDKTVDRSNSLFSGASSEETFRGMLYDQVSEAAANRPGGLGFGLAEAIYRQLEAQLPKEKNSDASSLIKGDE